MRIRILEAAKQEFAAHGLAGARVDRIAAEAGANKRMLYYHVGNKEDLYLEALEGAYEKIRVEERGLDLEHLDPPEAIEPLIDFTWNYFFRNPEFLALLNTENLAKARHLKRSIKVKSMRFAVRRDDPHRGHARRRARGLPGRDRPGATLHLDCGSVLLLSFEQRDAERDFGRDLLTKEARDERLDHMVALVLAALTGKSAAAFGKGEAVKPRAVAHRVAPI